jgi:RNA polymerase sigma factor (sigma-70 family)
VAAAPVGDAALRRVAVETYVRNEGALRRTARRYSLCADDAEDALQRGLEILLKKAPSEDPRELIRWTQTVVKHEALAVRRERERILSGPAAVTPEPGREDWVALIPAPGDGPAEQAERREAVARSREALQALKPQELRALSLLAEGYSYQEIGEITGYSRTKINRCLAEGRERFRRIVSRSEDGRRCAELVPLLSAFCDDEAAADEVATVREHLRACPHCRATLRAYRAAPGAAAAFAPALPFGRSLLDRLHDAVVGLGSRFAGGGSADSAMSQVAAAGGTRGAGIAALAKVMAVCVGAVGGAGACVATGVIPAPLGIGPDDGRPTKIEQRATLLDAVPQQEVAVDYEPAPSASPSPPVDGSKPKSPKVREAPEPEPSPPPAPEPVTSSEVVETAPPPTPAAPIESAPSAAAEEGSAAGEFGP